MTDGMWDRFGYAVHPPRQALRRPRRSMPVTGLTEIDGRVPRSGSAWPTSRASARGSRRLSVLDRRLAALTARGDETAFEGLYDRHWRSLLAFCRHVGRPPG